MATVPEFVAQASTWTEAVAWWTGRSEIAVSAGTLEWSGAELIERALGAAKRLTELSAEEGPIPALFTSTPVAFAYLIGGPAVGRPIAPLGPRLTPAELLPSVEGLGAPVLLCEPEFEATARELAERTGVAVEVVEIPERVAGTLPLDLDPESLAFILHTSGTTGNPKPIPYSQGRMAERVRVNGGLFGLEPGKVYASASPLHHIGGFGSYGVALASGTAVVPMSRFTVDAWASLADLGVTHATTVPTIIEMLLDADVLGFDSLELLQYGASPIHPSTLTKMIEQLPRVRLLNNYGQTEGSPLTALTPEDHRSIFESGRTHLLESVGRAVESVELRFEEVDAEGVGEVVARATHLMRPDEDGWLRTGDLGRIDDEGFVFLSGRKGDMIIRGGENIYPVEVEQRLESHPAIREAAVVGIKDVKWGETVKAFLVVNDPAAAPSAQELQAYCRETLAGFKVPVEYEVVTELPRNAVGKLLRRKLLG